MQDSEYIHKSHNVSVLIYRLVTPCKYRRVVFDDKAVTNYLSDISVEIDSRYEIRFLEIGTDDDHVYFLIQSVPTYSPTKVAQITRSITAREMFKKFPELQKVLWGTEFWTKGFFISTVGKHGDETKLRNYIKNQGTKNYKAVCQKQLTLF